jgi:hypothetical protein
VLLESVTIQAEKVQVSKEAGLVDPALIEKEVIDVMDTSILPEMSKAFLEVTLA